MQPTISDPMTYGWLLTAVGMGGTLISLWLLSLLMVLLKRLLPPRPPEAPESPKERP